MALEHFDINVVLATHPLFKLFESPDVEKGSRDYLRNTVLDCFALNIRLSKTNMKCFLYVVKTLVVSDKLLITVNSRVREINNRTIGQSSAPVDRRFSRISHIIIPFLGLREHSLQLPNEPAFCLKNVKHVDVLSH